METNVLKMESFWQKHKKYAAEVYEIGTNVTGKQHGYGKYRQGKAELIDGTVFTIFNGKGKRRWLIF